MDFIISTSTDIGTKKKVNQDSIFAQKYGIGDRNAAFAIICDGVSGMNHGEKASGAVVKGFSDWACAELPILLKNPIEDYVIRKQWSALIEEKNSEIYLNGVINGYSSGTTATAILLTAERYFLLHVGDTRAYELYGGIRQLTEDHTVAAEEIRLGNIAPEQTKNSPMESMLTRCVGAVPEVRVDFFFGDTKRGAIYMLCCDGFRHKVSKWEIYECLMKGDGDSQKMKQCEKHLIELNKQRGETDNISVITITQR